MAYPGGKARAGVYQKIINQIPPHEVYIESFLGDGAIMRRKRPAALNIGVEIDPAVASGFAGELLPDVGDDGSSGPSSFEVHNCCGIDWLRYAFGLYRVSPSGGIAGTGDGRSTPAGTPESAAGSAAAPFSGLGPFVYCDPPYLMETRRSGRLYRHEMTDAQHEQLLDVVRRLPCPVAISGYDSPLYAAALENWRKITFQAMTRGGRPATECVWMNYPEPAELHDYRFLGRNKRERERINRRVRNWTGGLKRLPRLERQAIIDAIGGGGRTTHFAIVVQAAFV